MKNLLQIEPNSISKKPRNLLMFMPFLSQGFCTNEAENTIGLPLWSHHSQCVLMAVALCPCKPQVSPATSGSISSSMPQVSLQLHLYLNLIQHATGKSIATSRSQSHPACLGSQYSYLQLALWYAPSVAEQQTHHAGDQAYRRSDITLRGGVLPQSHVPLSHGVSLARAYALQPDDYEQKWSLRLNCHGNILPVAPRRQAFKL